MKPRVLILSLSLVLLLLAAGATLANGGASLPRGVLSAGASDATAPSASLQATLGQPLVGVISAGDITLGQGFWRGGLPTDHKVYLPIVLRGG